MDEKYKYLIFINLILNIVLLTSSFFLYNQTSDVLDSNEKLKEDIILKQAIVSSNEVFKQSINSIEIVANENNILLLEDALLTYNKSKCMHIDDSNIKYDCLTKVEFNIVSSLVISENNSSYCITLLDEKLIETCVSNYEKYLEVSY